MVLFLASTLCLTSTKTRAARDQLPDGPEKINSVGFEIAPSSVFTESGLAKWSLLTIFLAHNRALCSHESQTETGPLGSLSYVWREARRKM